MSAQQPPSPLAQLHDVIVVEQVSSWPPAPIWYVLLCLVLILASALLIYLKKRRHYQQAKRQAVMLANNITEIDKPLSLAQLNELQIILKRVAKHYYGNQLAALSGQSWLLFINKVSKCQLDLATSNLLYQAQVTEQQSSELKSALSCAIKSINIKPSYIKQYHQGATKHV